MNAIEPRPCRVYPGNKDAIKPPPLNKAAPSDAYARPLGMTAPAAGNEAYNLPFLTFERALKAREQVHSPLVSLD
jgi:hypothetical protein